jgi:hypothetical protein
MRSADVVERQHRGEHLNDAAKPLIDGEDVIAVPLESHPLAQRGCASSVRRATASGTVPGAGRRADPKDVQFPPGLESTFERMTSETPQPGGARASGVGLRVSMRHYFSTHLLWMAFQASGRAEQIEDAHTGEPTFDIEHHSYVLTAIASAAGFLEAAINELFQDAHDRHGLTDDGYLAPVQADAITAMAATWRGTDQGVKLSALEKWQLLLIFSGREPLDRGAAPYQDAHFVTRLRNMILHFRPESVAVDEVHRLEGGLRGRFAENRLMAGSQNPWWPSHCLGHGCAEWAAQSVVAFSDRVCGELSIEPNYQRVAEHWHGKPPGSWGT